MFLTGECTKCKEEIRVDIENLSKEEAIEKIKGWSTFSCPGKHVELSSPYPYYWPMDDWKLVEGTSPSEEEWIEALKKEKNEIFTTEDLREKFEVESFAMGTCIAKDKSDGGKVYLDFASSPKGERYYWKM